MSRKSFASPDVLAPLAVTASPQAEMLVRTGANRLWAMVRDSDNKILLVASDILNVAKRRLEIQASDVSFPSGTVTISGGTLESALSGEGGAGVAPNIRLIRNVAPEIYFNRAGASLADYHKWKAYVSGAGSDSGPNDSAMSFAAMPDDESINLKTFRMYRDGRMLIGADPTAPLEVATKQYADEQAYGLAVSGATFTSLTLNTWTRINFPTPADMGGGVTWNPTLKGFVIPQDGVYVLSARVQAISNASASTVKLGISTAANLPANEIVSCYCPANANYWCNFGWQMKATAGDVFGLCAMSNVARSTDYNAFQIARV